MIIRESVEFAELILEHLMFEIWTKYKIFEEGKLHNIYKYTYENKHIHNK